MGANVALGSGRVVGVLEVAAGSADLLQAGDQHVGLESVTGFGVDRHRHLDAADDPGGGGQHQIHRRALVVVVAESGGDAGARGARRLRRAGRALPRGWRR
jgi:hypothetical protein